MAKAKKPVAPVVSNEVVEVIDFGPVMNEDGSPTETTVELLTGQPSLMSQLVQQVVDAEPAVVTETKAKSEKNEGVGLLIRRLIAEGLGNKEVLAIVHEQYGNKNTTYACVAWYRNNMKKAGQQVQKASALDFLTNFAKANNLSEESVEELKVQFKVA